MTLNLPLLQGIDAQQLLDMLLLPGCILILALAIGIALNKTINRRIERHMPGDEDSWQSILIDAMRGTPISFCLVSGLYWIQVIHE